LLEYRDGQVRLADAGRTFEKEALAHDGKRVGEAPRVGGGPLQRFVVRGEVRDRAVLIALRDVGVCQPLLPDRLAPAVAARHAADALVVDRLPAGVIAQRT